MACRLKGALAVLLQVWLLQEPAHAAGRHLCRQDENVLFSCGIRSKKASLCVSRSSGAVTQISYRFGTAAKTELEYVANASNGLHFAADVLPAAPGASVRQVWFVRGDVRYLVTQCVGGECSREAGLTVLRRGHVVSDKTCGEADDDLVGFDRDVVRFGSGMTDSASATDLLRLEDGHNPIERLYSAGRRR